MISDIIILAGGFGERLWPASSAEMPKQFLVIAQGLSFLQMSIKRALALKPSGKIVVVTRREIAAQCAEQCAALAKTLPQEQGAELLKKVCVLAESKPRHTAAAILLATYFVSLGNGGAYPGAAHTILVLTSDHVIETDEQFASDCAKADAAAEAGEFVCFAIPPSEPSSAYGYIKTGGAFATNSSAGELDGVFEIDNFEEKPDAATAQKYLAEGNYWWNSGMFSFTAQTLDAEMKILSPEIYSAFEPVRKSEMPLPKTQNGIAVYENWQAQEKAYETVPAVAIDKAIAEKTKRAAAVRTSFTWTDVGNWDTFSMIAKNGCESKIIQAQANNNFVYSDIPVALCGVDDLVVVIKNGNALVMKKGESSLVREVANKMKE